LPTPLSPVTRTLESTREATRQIERALHRLARGDDAGGIVRVARGAVQRPHVPLQLLLGGFQRLGDLRQCVVERLAPVERDILFDRFTPRVARLRDDVADRIAFAATACLPRVHLAATAEAEIPAGKAAQAPADRCLGAPDVQQVLLRFVAVFPDRFQQRPAGRRGFADPLDHGMPEERQQRCAGVLPLRVRIPGKVAPEVLGGTPAMREAEAGEHHPRAVPPEILDELPAQETERRGIEKNDSRCAEANDSSVGREREDFVVMEVRSSMSLSTPPMHLLKRADAASASALRTAAGRLGCEVFLEVRHDRFHVVAPPSAEVPGVAPRAAAGGIPNPRDRSRIAIFRERRPVPIGGCTTAGTCRP
jgi:hypothetical protein